MLNASDVKTLRSKGMSNMDILKNMGRIVPSAQRSYESIIGNTSIPEWQKESTVGRMLDKKVPTNAPSGMGYMAVSGMDLAQSAVTQKANLTAMQDEHRSFFDSYQAEDMRGKGLSAVGGGLANIGLSSARFVGNLGLAAINTLNPDMEKNTVYNIGRAAAGAGVNAIETAAGFATGKNQEDLINFGKGEEIASSIGQTYKKNYFTSFDDTVNHIYEDPASFLNDMMLAASAAGAATKVTGNVVSRMGSPVAGKAMEKFGGELAVAAMRADPGYQTLRYGGKATKAVAKTAYGVGKSITKSAVAQGVGIGRGAVDEILTDLPNYTRAEQGLITSEKLGERVSGAITSKGDELTGVGTMYEKLRESGQTANIGTDWFDSALAKKGIQVVKTGDKVTLELTKKAPALTSGDLGTLLQLRSQYFTNAVQGVDDILHIRDVLSGKAKYGSDMTNAGQGLFRGIRSNFDDAAKGSMKGLREADELYSPKVTELSHLRKQWMENVDMGNGARHWVLNKNKLSTIRSMSNKGREASLKELEKLTPGIGKEIKALMAFEDVTSSMGPKVGTYIKAGITLSGFQTLNPLLIATGIILQPQVFIPILKGFSRVRGISQNMINSIIGKIDDGVPLTKAETAVVQKVYNSAEKALKAKSDESARAARTTPPQGLSQSGIGSRSQLDTVPVQSKAVNSMDDVVTTGGKSINASDLDDVPLSQIDDVEAARVQGLAPVNYDLGQKFPDGTTHEGFPVTRMDVPANEIKVFISPDDPIAKGFGSKGGDFPPPVLRKLKDGSYITEDGAHRVDLFQRKGYETIPSIVIDESVAALSSGNPLALPRKGATAIKSRLLSATKAPPCVEGFKRIVEQFPDAVPQRGMFGSTIEAAAKRYSRNLQGKTDSVLEGFDHVKAIVDGKLLDNNPILPSGSKFFSEQDILYFIQSNNS